MGIPHRAGGNGLDRQRGIIARLLCELRDGLGSGNYGFGSESALRVKASTQSHGLLRSGFQNRPHSSTSSIRNQQLDRIGAHINNRSVFWVHTTGTMLRQMFGQSLPRLELAQFAQMTEQNQPYGRLDRKSVV